MITKQAIWLGFLATACFYGLGSAQWCQPNGVRTPNPRNCSTYFQCDNGNNILRPCAPGTHFNARTSMCDWPNIANCNAQGCQPHGRLTPNPGDCSTYFRCDNGNNILQTCASGMHFNVKNQMCDWPYNANCNVQVYPLPTPTQPPQQDVECYSCAYIQGNINLTNVGCENDPPPRKYKRTDCYGFGNLPVAGGYRHSAGQSHSAGSAYHPQNTHCVKISGKTDAGNAVIMRGCEDFTESNRTFSNWTCFTKREYEFPMPGIGMVRNVEKCYCKGRSCNGSSILGASQILTILLLSYFAIPYFKF